MPFASRVRVLVLLVLGSLAALANSAALAAVPASDTLLPASTKGYISIAKPEDMKERWKKTQYGQMFGDEVMKDFVEDLRKQLNDKFGVIEDKLGLVWNDLDGVPAGELSVSIFERKDREAGLAITIDVTDHKEQADKLLAAVEKRLTKRGARKTNVTVDGTSLTVFTQPAAGADKPARETVYFVKDNLLCGIDDRAEAEAILMRFGAQAAENLRSLKPYAASMDRCKNESQGLEPELRWYADPFGLIFAARTLNKTPRNPHDKDTAKILHDQGFDAIQGAGGYLNLLGDGGADLLYRVSIYAPPVPNKENDPLRWNLSMRMLQLPNTSAHEPPVWAPRMSASYTSLNLDLASAFDNIGPVFDALKGHKGAWANSLEGWQIDQFGPQVDIRKEFIGNMGQRLVIVTDYTTPITTASERSLFAIEARNETALAATLAKWMKTEHVEKRNVGQYVVWERMPEEEDNDLDSLNVELPGAVGSNKTKDDKKNAPVMPHSASCVALGHLMIASDIEYLKEILAGFPPRERLVGSDDFQQVLEAMNRVDSGQYSVWSFARTDEELRPTYELIRQGKMPQSDTLLGKVLNNLLTTDVERKEGTPRKQRIDGGTLPNFETVRRYFGPTGRTLRSDKDGWMLSGVVLNKEAP